MPNATHCRRTRHRQRVLAALWLTAVGALPAPPVAADSGTIQVGAVVLSKSNCRFNNGALTLDFGEIDPSSNTNATATATKVFRCGGSATNATFSITAGSGDHFSGGTRRMQHGTTTSEYLAYSLALSPATATVPKNVDQTLTITGTITPAQFGNAIAGAYSDTVTLTINP